MISTAFWNPIGAKCKCGSEAKEVEFLRNRPSVCLTLLMGPGFTFSPDTGTVQQIIELGLLSSVLPSAGHWGTVIVALHTWGRLLIALWSGDTDNLQKWFLPFSVLTKKHGLKKRSWICGVKFSRCSFEASFVFGVEFLCTAYVQVFCILLSGSGISWPWRQKRPPFLSLYFLYWIAINCDWKVKTRLT